MPCHATILIHRFTVGARVVGKCACGMRTGELVYRLASERVGTIEAAGFILRLLHKERKRTE